MKTLLSGLLIFGCAISASAQGLRSGVAVAPDSGVAGGTARASETEDRPTLSAEDAVAAAIGNHPAIHAAEAAIRREQHQAFQATRSPNPVVGYLASEVGNERDAGQQGVFLWQEIVRGDKLCLDGQIQRREAAVAMQRLSLQKIQLEADVHFAYINVAYVQERLRLLQRLQSSLDGAVAAVRTLVRSGELGTSASLQSQLEARRNRMKSQQTKTALETAQQRLAVAIGWREFHAEVSPEILHTAPEDNVENRWQAIQSSSPELSLASLQQEVARAQVTRAQVEPVPNLQTQWSVQQDAATDHTVFGIQLGVELPVRDQNRGAIGAAEAETWRLHHVADVTARSLRQRFVLVAGLVRQSGGQLQIIQDELESLALQNVTTTQQAFRLGEASYVDLLNAQRAYIALSLEKLELLKQLAIAEANLRTFLVRAPETPK